MNIFFFLQFPTVHVRIALILQLQFSISLFTNYMYILNREREGVDSYLKMSFVMIVFKFVEVWIRICLCNKKSNLNILHKCQIIFLYSVPFLFLFVVISLNETQTLLHTYIIQFKNELRHIISIIPRSFLKMKHLLKSPMLWQSRKLNQIPL